jgi:hypothetical protein
VVEKDVSAAVDSAKRPGPSATSDASPKRKRPASSALCVIECRAARTPTPALSTPPASSAKCAVDPKVKSSLEASPAIPAGSPSESAEEGTSACGAPGSSAKVRVLPVRPPRTSTVRLRSYSDTRSAPMAKSVEVSGSATP